MHIPAGRNPHVTAPRLKPEFDQRGVKAIGLSVDAIDSHGKWADDIRETQGYGLDFPLVADPDRKVAWPMNMLTVGMYFYSPEDKCGSCRTP